MLTSGMDSSSGPRWWRRWWQNLDGGLCHVACGGAELLLCQLPSGALPQPVQTGSPLFIQQVIDGYSDECIPLKVVLKLDNIV